MIEIDITKTYKRLDTIFWSRYFYCLNKVDKSLFHPEKWIEMADLYHSLLMRNDRKTLVLNDNIEREEISKILSREIKSAEVFNYLKPPPWIQDLKNTLSALILAVDMSVQLTLDGIDINKIKRN
jgi:hypothetical protein